jgi:hypothetical protein
MIHGPNRNTNSAAVTIAPPVRKVMYRKTLKTGIAPERSISQ